MSVLAGLALVLAVMGSSVVAAEPEPALLASQVVLVPSNGIALQGGQITVDVRIGHVGYLAGYSFRLLYDPAKIQVVDSDPSIPGVQIAAGDVFASKDSQSFGNIVDNTLGRIVYGEALVGSNKWVNVPAPQTKSLARVTFQLVGAGTSAVSFDESGQLTNLSDRNGLPIACTWVGGQVTAAVATNHLYVPLVAKNWH